MKAGARRILRGGGAAKGASASRKTEIWRERDRETEGERQRGIKRDGEERKMRNERWRRRGWSRERKGEGESSERDLRKERDVGEERESRGEGAHRKGRRREAGACARAAESSPSSEIQDPSRERAADGKHSLDRGDGLRLGATRRRVRPLLRASLPVSLARTRSLLSRTRSRQRSHKLGSTRRTGRPASCGFLLRDRFDRVGLDVGLDHLEPRGS